MISCAHLVGHIAMKNFIKSGGILNKDDDNGTTCAEYLKGFMGYTVNYSVEEYVHKKPAPQKPTLPSFPSLHEKATRCASLYEKLDKLKEEYNNRIKPFAKEEAPFEKKVELPDKQQEAARQQERHQVTLLYQDIQGHHNLLSKNKCSQYPRDFYNEIIRRYPKKEDKGNSR
jgi:hypothetical protein